MYNWLRVESSLFTLHSSFIILIHIFGWKEKLTYICNL